MDLDLGHLEGAQRNIGKDFCASRARKPDERLVLVGILLPSKVAVEVLEDFVETVLERSLERVSDKRRAETFPDTLRTLLCHDEFDARYGALVFAGVDLSKVYQ